MPLWAPLVPRWARRAYRVPRWARRAALAYPAAARAARTPRRPSFRAERWPSGSADEAGVLPLVSSAEWGRASIDGPPHARWTKALFAGDPRAMRDPRARRAVRTPCGPGPQAARRAVRTPCGPGPQAARPRAQTPRTASAPAAA